MRFTAFKLPRHRVFHYEPVYYDKAKEKRKDREHQAKEELGMLSDEEFQKGIASRVKGKMRKRIVQHYEVTRKAKRVSNIRLLVILIALFALFIYLIKSGQQWIQEFGF